MGELSWGYWEAPIIPIIAIIALVKTPLLAAERRDTGVVFIYPDSIWQMVLKFRLPALAANRQSRLYLGIIEVKRDSSAISTLI